MTERAEQLRALAAKVEAASADEQRAMLEEAFEAIHGKSAQWLMWYADRIDTQRLGNRFFQLIAAGGFLDAAVSLVPAGATFSVTRRVCGEPSFADIDLEYFGNAASPPLAATAAALRAIAAEEDKP